MDDKVEWQEDERLYEMHEIVERFGVEYIVVGWSHRIGSDTFKYEAVPKEKYDEFNYE